MDHRVRTDRLSIRWTLTFAFVSALFFGSSLYAQDPAQDKFPPEFYKKLEADRKAVGEMIRGEYNNELIKNYVRDYIVPRLTKYTQPIDMKDAKNEITVLLDAKLKMESRVQMSDVMVERLREIVLAPAAQPSKYHPSSRLLALTILGQIDQKPAVTSGGKTDPAVPHPEAFKALVNAFRGANKEGNFADAFLIGALVGLERHAKEASKTWDAATKSGLAKILSEQLVGEPPAVREPAVHVFVQRRLLETLMTFDTPEHAPAKRFIIDQLKNKDADSNLRLLCLFQLPKASKSIQPDELDALSTSVVHFLKHEVKKWDDSVKDPAQMGMMGGAMASSGGKGMGAPGSDIGMESGSSGAEYTAGAAGMGMGSDETYGMMGSATGSSAKFNPLDQPPEVRIARRKLTAVLEYSRFGLDGAVSIQKGKSIPDPKNQDALLYLLKDNPNASELRRLIDMITVMHDTINGNAIVPVPPGSTQKPDPNKKIVISTIASVRTAMRKPVANFLEACDDFPGVKAIDEPEEDLKENKVAAADNVEKAGNAVKAAP